MRGSKVDTANVTSHSIELTGLAPATTYQRRVCNRHAIDGDCLAAKTGSFTTQASTPQVVQAIDDLSERVVPVTVCNVAQLEVWMRSSKRRSCTWQAGQATAACGALQAFLNEVSARAGKKLTQAQAQQLTATTNKHSLTNRMLTKARIWMRGTLLTRK